jgi:IS1 family transposase
MTGAAKNTVVKYLARVGEACAVYQNRVMRNLASQRVQIDEIWSYCYAKAKNVPAEKRDTFGYGDVWTFVAIDADTKLVPSWMVGERKVCDAKSFAYDVAARLTNRVQLTTDGHRMYLEAVESAFGGDIDFAQLIKIYGNHGRPENPESRYSPGECCGTEIKVISGSPDMADVSTSFVERQNLTMRMRMRRFTRLTNGFSKKLENHCHSIALHFMVYNFVTRHQTLRMPPALKAHVTDHVWTLEEVAEMVENYRPEQNSGEIAN